MRKWSGVWQLLGRRWGWTLFCLVLLGGCATVPVQQMSNARQAIAAAQAAGAARVAPAKLAAAQHWLDDAEFALKGGDYAHARQSANKARKLAIEAANAAHSKNHARPSEGDHHQPGVTSGNGAAVKGDSS